jgi:hypothetical protein
MKHVPLIRDFLLLHSSQLLLPRQPHSLKFPQTPLFVLLLSATNLDDVQIPNHVFPALGTSPPSIFNPAQFPPNIPPGRA